MADPPKTHDFKVGPLTLSFADGRPAWLHGPGYVASGRSPYGTTRSGPRDSTTEPNPRKRMRLFYRIPIKAARALAVALDAWLQTLPEEGDWEEEAEEIREVLGLDEEGVAPQAGDVAAAARIAFSLHASGCLECPWPEVPAVLLGDCNEGRRLHSQWQLALDSPQPPGPEGGVPNQALLRQLTDHVQSCSVCMAHGPEGCRRAQQLEAEWGGAWFPREPPGPPTGWRLPIAAALSAYIEHAYACRQCDPSSPRCATGEALYTGWQALEGHPPMTDPNGCGDPECGPCYR